MNNYMIVQTLGKGSFGETFLAVNKADKQQYAVKKYITRNIATTRGEFDLDEGLKHEVGVLKMVLSICGKIAPCFKESFTEGSDFYIVMQFIDGRSVFDMSLEHPQRRVKLASRQTKFRRILTDLTKGLQMLHSTGIVHQDLKGENIMWDNTSKSFKFIDFGLACNINSGYPTIDGEIFSYNFRTKPCGAGNRMHHPPEMLTDNFENIINDIWSEEWIRGHDIWSLGLVLFTWFTVPDGQSYRDLADDLFVAHGFTNQQQIYDPVFASMSVTDPELYQVLMKCFTRDPQLRVDYFNLLYYSNDTNLDAIPTWNDNAVTQQAKKNHREWSDSLAPYRKAGMDDYKEYVKKGTDAIDKRKRVQINTSRNKTQTFNSKLPASSVQPVDRSNLPVIRKPSQLAAPIIVPGLDLEEGEVSPVTIPNFPTQKELADQNEWDALQGSAAVDSDIWAQMDKINADLSRDKF